MELNQKGFKMLVEAIEFAVIFVVSVMMFGFSLAVIEHFTKEVEDSVEGEL